MRAKVGETVKTGKSGETVKMGEAVNARKSAKG